jgi:membrane protein YqaA with SNARE-associated domain
MALASKLQLFRDKVVSRRSFQISVFVFILALSTVLFLLARSRLDLESFLAYGYSGVLLINLVCCATILFPIPGEAVNIAAGASLNPLLVGMVATVGATIGEPTSYLVGYLGRKIIPGGYLEKHEQAEYWMKKYGSFAIFLFALLPILIFDLIGIVAGSARFPLWKFVLACFAGRLLRCLTEAYLGYGLFGFLPQLW